MADVYAVLKQKERELERARREVWALLTVIPLLAEEPSAANAGEPIPVEASASAGARDAKVEPVRGEARPDDLDVYFPFVRHLARGQ